MMYLCCRLKYYNDGDVVLHHKRGIYSIADKVERKILCSSETGCTGASFCIHLRQIEMQ